MRELSVSASARAGGVGGAGQRHSGAIRTHMPVDARAGGVGAALIKPVFAALGCVR